MNSTAMSLFAAVFSLLLVSFTHSAAVRADNVSGRAKRQTADVRTAEYLAWAALHNNGCKKVACGVIDIYKSGKRKRAPAAVQNEKYGNLLNALIARAAMAESPDMDS